MNSFDMDRRQFLVPVRGYNFARGNRLLSFRRDFCFRSESVPSTMGTRVRKRKAIKRSAKKKKKTDAKVGFFNEIQNRFISRSYRDARRLLIGNERM